MHHPTTRRGRDTVRRILDAACELFVRKGIRSTTLDQVGAASGTGRGQLYHYFNDKTDLVVAVVDEQVRRTVEPGVAILRSISTAGQLEKVGAQIAAHYSDPPRPIRCPIGSLIYELGPDDHAARSRLADAFARWCDAWSDTLDRLRDAGHINADTDTDATGAALLAAYQGAILLAAISDDTRIIQTAIDAVVTPLMRSTAA